MNTEKVSLVERFKQHMGEDHAADYLIRQCAEECTEQAQALLKYLRVKYNELTNVEPNEAYDHLVEEIADVTLCTGMVLELLGIPRSAIEEWIAKKIERSNQRMNEVEEARYELADEAPEESGE